MDKYGYAEMKVQRRTDRCAPDNAGIAQSVEQRIRNAQVRGSTPLAGISLNTVDADSGRRSLHRHRHRKDRALYAI